MRPGSGWALAGSKARPSAVFASLTHCLHNRPVATLSSNPLLLDVRSAADFTAGHLPQAASIPLETLNARVHELPERCVPICLLDDDAARLQSAQAMLQARGYQTTFRLVSPADCTESGPSRVHLWQPNPLLLQAMNSYPAPLAARALDLACGTGRDAAYLALHGYEVDAVDILPDALARATSLASHCGVTIHTICADLRHDWPFAEAGYDLVSFFRFLHRPMLPRLPGLLRPGGLLVIETFHEASAKTAQGPANPSHLLKTGELAAIFGQLKVLHQADAVERGGRFFSQLVARHNAPV